MRVTTVRRGVSYVCAAVVATLCLCARSGFAQQSPTSAALRTDGVPGVSLGPLEAATGTVSFDAPSGPYQAIVTADGVGPSPDPERHACVAPCSMQLRAGSWGVEMRWGGSNVGSDSLRIEAGVSARRAYERPRNQEGFPASARALDPGAERRFRAGFGLLLSGSALMTYSVCGVIAVAAHWLGGGGAAPWVEPVGYSSLVSLGIGPALTVIAAGLLNSVSDPARQTSALAPSRLAPAFSASRAGVFAGVHASF